jgi:hypothetical protein
MSNWAYDEVETADLGDRRLNARLAKVLDLLGNRPQASIPAACGGWSETLGAYRLFDNPKATFETVLAPHRDATLARLAAVPVALLAQDTTDDDETLNLGPKGLGTIKNVDKRERRLHPTVAFTPQRVCLGVVDALHWVREQPSPRRARRDKGVDQKESRCWVESYQTSCAVQGQLPDTLIVNVSDAEGDLYELFAEADSYDPATRAQWIVRAAQDRLLADGPDADAPRKLWQALVRAPALGRVEVDVKARPQRPARLAVLTLRSAAVRLLPPRRPQGCRLPALAVNAVLAREENPPPGVEPLEWVLTTSLPIDSFERAATVAAWYSVRWCIEVYFFVLKHGCQVDALQLETEDRQLPCLAIYMIVAWRVLFATMLGRTCPDADCEAVFAPEEWRAAYIVARRCPPPSEPPRLGEMVILIATLGGYLNRKHDGPPGPKTFWVGLQRVREFVVALAAREEIAGSYV